MPDRRPCSRMTQGIGRVSEGTWRGIKAAGVQMQRTILGPSPSVDKVRESLSNFALPQSPRIPQRALGPDGKLRLTDAEKKTSNWFLDGLNSPSEILPTMYDAVSGAWRQMELARSQAYGILEGAVSSLSKSDMAEILEDLKAGRAPRNEYGKEIKNLLDKISQTTRRGTRVDRSGQTILDLFQELDRRGLKPKLNDILQRYIAGRLSVHYLNEPLKILDEALMQLPSEKLFNKRKYAKHWIDNIKGQMGSGGIDEIIEKFAMQGKLPGAGEFFAGGVSRGYIGLSPGTAIKNLTQQMNDIKDAGFIAWGKATAQTLADIGFRPTRWRAKKAALAEKGVVQAVERLFDIPMGGSRWRKTMDDGLFSMMNMAESYNRMVSFQISANRASRLGMSGEEALLYSLDWVRKNHFELSHIDRAPILTKGAIGRVGSTLLTFNLKQFVGTGSRHVRELWTGLSEAAQIYKGTGKRQDILFFGKREVEKGARDAFLKTAETLMPTVRLAAIFGVATKLTESHFPVDLGFLFDFIPGMKGLKYQMPWEQTPGEFISTTFEYGMNPVTSMFGDLAAVVNGDENATNRFQKAFMTVLLPAYATLNKWAETAPSMFTAWSNNEPIVISEYDRRQVVVKLADFLKGQIIDMPDELKQEKKKVYDQLDWTEAVTRMFRLTPSREGRKMHFYQALRRVQKEGTDIEITPEERAAHNRAMIDLRKIRGPRSERSRVSRAYYRLSSKQRVKVTPDYVDTLYRGE